MARFTDVRGRPGAQVRQHQLRRTGSRTYVKPSIFSSVLKYFPTSPCFLSWLWLKFLYMVQFVPKLEENSCVSSYTCFSISKKQNTHFNNVTSQHPNHHCDCHKHHSCFFHYRRCLKLFNHYFFDILFNQTKHVNIRPRISLHVNRLFQASGSLQLFPTSASVHVVDSQCSFPWRRPKFFRHKVCWIQLAFARWESDNIESFSSTSCN